MHRNEKGFTLMELMVVIVIVAILAAVAVPLYINYVKDAQRTDAKAAIGALITAEHAYYLKCPPNVTPIYAGTVADLVSRGVIDVGFQNDVAKRWTIEITTVETPPSFTVTATSISDASMEVTYTYAQATGGTWTDTPVTP
jgi:prepilin-type N-terminal cleavage/methylation domain-containing protein